MKGKEGKKEEGTEIKRKRKEGGSYSHECTNVVSYLNKEERVEGTTEVGKTLGEAGQGSDRASEGVEQRKLRKEVMKRNDVKKWKWRIGQVRTESRKEMEKSSEGEEMK